LWYLLWGWSRVRVLIGEGDGGWIREGVGADEWWWW
jgi:hypothetical protein